MADDLSDIYVVIPYRRAADVSVSAGKQKGESRFFLKAPGGTVFTFREQEHFLWKSLDGHLSVGDLERAFGAEFGLKLTLDDLSAFIADGVRCGLIERTGDPGSAFDLAAARRPKPARPDGAPGQDAKAKGQRPNEPLPQKAGTRHVTPIGREPWTIIIGDPTRLFAVLGFVFGGLRHVKWFVFPAALFATMILMKNSPQFQSDWRKITTSVPWWPFMYTYEHFLNFVARVTEGTILQANGAPVRYIGVRFLMGVILRGFIDEHAARTMPEAVRLWSKAGVLLIRLALFSLAAFLWIMLRQTHPVAAESALFVCVLSFILFCVNACPFVPAEGYELLGAFVNKSRLAIRAFRFIGISLGGGEIPEAMSDSERAGLGIFALGTFLLTTYLLTRIIIDMGNFIAGALGGLGYLIMTIIIIAAIVYIRLAIKFNIDGGEKAKSKTAISRLIRRNRRAAAGAADPDDGP